MSTYISELDQPQLSELTNAVIFRAGLQKQLRQAHLLTPEHHLYLPHRQILLRCLVIAPLPPTVAYWTRTTSRSLQAKTRHRNKSAKWAPQPITSPPGLINASILIITNNYDKRGGGCPHTAPVCFSAGGSLGIYWIKSSKTKEESSPMHLLRGAIAEKGVILRNLYLWHLSSSQRKNTERQRKNPKNDTTQMETSNRQARG